MALVVVGGAVVYLRFVKGWTLADLMYVSNATLKSFQSRVTEGKSGFCTVLSRPGGTTGCGAGARGHGAATVWCRSSSCWMNCTLELLQYGCSAPTPTSPAALRLPQGASGCPLQRAVARSGTLTSTPP